ncbi:MAG: hypothetical protein M3Q09_00145 [Gemmatimonadota bacterium]|nr:hypothetical protein [Gemmatimonadota bacterium]
MKAGLIMIVATVTTLRTVTAQPATPPLPDTATRGTGQTAGSRLDFSGVLYAHFLYRADTGLSRGANRFDVERAYLTFRMPAGNRTSIRITTDLYQQTTPGNDAYYRGWSVRAKYAYVQHTYLTGAKWRANARLGILQNVFIEHDEQFWPRWISQSPTERAGFFSSADVGIATAIAFPKKLGEVYATLTNGPGYTSRETDRFKDYAARVTVTPWGQSKSSLIQTASLSAWGYTGAVASKFVSGGVAQSGPIGSSLRRDRWGVHAGARSQRLTMGAEYAARIEEGEAGLNTAALPRTVTDSTIRLVSGYAIGRPLGDRSQLSLVGRYDRVTTNTATRARYDVVIAGLIWDLSDAASLSVDYQENNPQLGSPIASARTYFAHCVVRF